MTARKKPPRPEFAYFLSILVVVTALCHGCGGPAVGTFQQAREVADGEARAWSGDAALYYFGGSSIGSDGSATSSGGWTLKFLAKSQPGLQFAVFPGEAAGLSGPFDGDLDSGVSPSAAAAAIAAWDEATDSGKWFSDAHWTAEDHADGLYFAAENAIIARINPCDSRSVAECAPDAEAGALRVELLAAGPAGDAVSIDPTAIEVAPTYRPVTLRLPPTLTPPADAANSAAGDASVDRGTRD